MIDFDQMARNILWEQNVNVSPAGTQPPATNTQTSQQQINTTTPQISSTDNEDQAKQEQASLFGFLKNKFSELKTIWSKFPSVYKFPGDNEIQSLCYNVVISLPRATKTPDKFPNFESIFPLIDIIAQLYELNYKKGTDPSTANTTYAEVIKRINDQMKSNRNFKPLDYFALNPWTQSIKSVYLQTAKQELGKLRLENQDKKASIFQLIYVLLAIRKKTILPKLPASVKTVSGDNLINKIMLEPWNLIANKPYPINDEKLRVTYDEITTRQLINVSLAAYKLYKQQLLMFFKEEETKTLLQDPDMYNLFMGKGQAQAKPMTWTNAPSNTNVGSYEPGIQASMQVASFDQSFELLTKQLVNEAGQNDVDTRTPAERMRDIRDNVSASHMANRTSRFRNFATQITQASTDEEVLNATKERIKDPNFASQLQDLLDKEVLNNTEEKIKDSKFRSEVEKLMPKENSNSDSNNQKPFETEKGTNTFVYSFEKLKEAKTMFKIEEAANLLAELQNLADFIKKKEGADIMGGLNKIAQGMSFGVRNMGT